MPSKPTSVRLHFPKVACLSYSSDKTAGPMQLREKGVYWRLIIKSEPVTIMIGEYGRRQVALAL